MPKTMPKTKRAPSPIIQHFGYEHLPEELQAISKPICNLAKRMDRALPDGPQKREGLQRLLEAKDCLVRAAREEGQSVSDVAIAAVTADIRAHGPITQALRRRFSL